ncbi:hypothetical protein I5L51_21040 [Pseudomonas mendocina]|nr:hypothetical protein [Pseudomonas mendocina]MBH3341601.1 hypothetical protein [Pseudomonas mendocina]
MSVSFDKSIANIFPKIDFPRKMSTAWCSIAFEELASAIDFIELGVEQMNPDQKMVWSRYKAMTAQFADDMLLAEGDRMAIRRRLGLGVDV